MIPEEYLIDFAIRHWEEDENEAGWDEPAKMMMALMMPGGETFALMPTPVEPSRIDPHLPTAMRMAADGWESQAVREIMARQDVLRYQEVAGYFVCYEAWRTMTPPDERDYRKVADMPGSVETRTVMGVDCGGRLYYLERVRGQEPTLEIFRAGDSRMVGGDLSYHLIRLLKASMRFAPADTWDLPALNALMRHVRKAETW